MLNLQAVLIETFAREIENVYFKNYGITDPPCGNIAAWAGRFALEQIANADALYHNVEHTIMVSSVGLVLLQGKHMIDGGVTPNDWLHFMLAVLFHDVGYVRPICDQDQGNEVATGIGDQTVTLPANATDAALEPYHVDRSKLFIRQRFGSQTIRHIDGERVAAYIEMTRFPAPLLKVDVDEAGYMHLVRAADVIGQLGDPNYLRKIPALYYEFQELGRNTQLGYTSPNDMRRQFARFYWDFISPNIQDALSYLRVTHEGKQWIANLYAHVFEIEHASWSVDRPAEPLM